MKTGWRRKSSPAERFFPRSDRALDVLSALLSRLERSGAALSLDEAVTGIERVGESFQITAANRSLTCSKLIVTTGGKSYPGCGTTGEGYAWLAAMGHTIRRPRPALVPLMCDEAWVHELSGLTIPDVLLRVVDPAIDAKPARRRRSKLPPGVLIERRGSLLFTHFGLSGPAAMDVSRAVTAAKSPRDVRLVVDFLPGCFGCRVRRAVALGDCPRWPQADRERVGRRLAASTGRSALHACRRAARPSRGRAVERRAIAVQSSN